MFAAGLARRGLLKLGIFCRDVGKFVKEAKKEGLKVYGARGA